MPKVLKVENSEIGFPLRDGKEPRVRPAGSDPEDDLPTAPRAVPQVSRLVAVGVDPAIDVATCEVDTNEAAISVDR